MPAPYTVTLQNKVYVTPILNVEMEDLVTQMNDKKAQIKSLNEQLNAAIIDLNSLQSQFLAKYVHQTGSFP